HCRRQDRLDPRKPCSHTEEPVLEKVELLLGVVVRPRVVIADSLELFCQQLTVHAGFEHRVHKIGESDLSRGCERHSRRRQIQIAIYRKSELSETIDLDLHTGLALCALHLDRNPREYEVAVSVIRTCPALERLRPAFSQDREEDPELGS